MSTNPNPLTPNFKSSYYSTAWVRLPVGIQIFVGVIGSFVSLVILWNLALEPLRWPSLGLTGKYFITSVFESDTYLGVIATGARAILGMLIGFGMALFLALLTGRTVLGWIAFFFLLLTLQKIPALAMVHVFVSSKLGIGFLMSVTLAATVVLTFTWLILHHRAQTLDPVEIFSLRVTGFTKWQRTLYGVIPHFGSTIGGALRLAMSISIIMVIIGEWQGVWSDGTIWEHGLGVQIVRYYEAVDSEARVLASCLWLGILGILLDGLVQLILKFIRMRMGVDLKR